MSRTKLSDAETKERHKEYVENGTKELKEFFTKYNLTYPLSLKDMSDAFKKKTDEIDFFISLLTVLTKKHLANKDCFPEIRKIFFDESITSYDLIKSYAKSLGIEEGFYHSDFKPVYIVDAPVKTKTKYKTAVKEVESHQSVCVSDNPTNKLDIEVTPTELPHRYGILDFDTSNDIAIRRIMDELKAQVDIPNAHVQKSVAKQLLNAWIGALVKIPVIFTFKGEKYHINDDDPGPDHKEQ